MSTVLNLPRGGISANYGGVTYTFTANYSGGDGNDLTLTFLSATSPTDTPVMLAWMLAVFAVLLAIAANWGLSRKTALV